MNNIKLALRSVFSWKKGQLGKIVFLGAGLAAGLMLLTKVWFEYSYEGFYPDTDRIFYIDYLYSHNEGGEELNPIGATPGGISPYLGERIPSIETYTRFTPLVWGETVFLTGEKQKLRGQFYMADDKFYDIFPRPMIQGKAKELLATPMMAIVSKSIAAAIDGDPIGQTIEPNGYPGKVLTIGGIFDDVPENTLYRYDILVSMESLPNFTFDGRERILGNDRYQSFIKLYPGMDLAELESAIDRIIEQTEEYKEVTNSGDQMKVRVSPVADRHKNDPLTKRTTLVLMILAAAIIFATVFNYILVVLSGTVARGKEIAVMKCHGAGFRQIAGRVMAETTIQLLVLLLTAGVLVLVFRGTAEQLLGTSLGGLITWQSSMLLASIILAILLLSTYVQARVYNNIPVASVFRSYKGAGRKMKLSLLFIQLFAAAFLTMLLVTVNRQYNAMIKDDPGYDYENLLTTSLHGIDATRKRTVKWELESIDVVEKVAMGSHMPFQGASGNNIRLDGIERDLFNIADMYYADENYLPILGVEVIEGRGFSKELSKEGDMMGNPNFVERILTFADWPDGVVGKDIIVSEHGDATITGVYQNFKLGVIGGEETRPTVLFYSENKPNLILIKMKEMGYDAISKVTETIQRMLPERDITVSVYADELLDQYNDSLLFRKSISIASIIVMMIVLVGLIGYTRDETARREKEIAIRKINGATVREILQIMSFDIVTIMVPAFLIGIAVSYYVAGRWMEEFSVKAPLHWWIALICAVALAAIAIGAVALTSLNVARKNPAESLKTE